MTSKPRPDPEARWLAVVENRFAAFGDRFNSLELARESGRNHVVCLGDSHLSVFRQELPDKNVAKPLIITRPPSPTVA